MAHNCLAGWIIIVLTRKNLPPESISHRISDFTDSTPLPTVIRRESTTRGSLSIPSFGKNKLKFHTHLLQ